MKKIQILLFVAVIITVFTIYIIQKPLINNINSFETESKIDSSLDTSNISNEEKNEGMQTETYYLDSNDRILAYIPNNIQNNENGTVPLVLNLHWTGGTPEEQVSENGWLDVSENEGFIMIAPFYNSYDSVYNHTDYFIRIVQDAFERFPIIDKSRVYITGFSNGGAAAIALTDQYPELFAAIAPEGWMVGMKNWRTKGPSFDMPFQIIQGSDEYTYSTDNGAKAIMKDEQEALSDLMLFNEMTEEAYEPNYEQIPYWGYPEDSKEILNFDNKEWTVSNYFKEGYSVPFGQLIFVQDGIHSARKPHAQLAWDFMKNFRRNEQGEIVEVTEK